MKWLETLHTRARGLTDSILRYPLTAAFLVAAAVLISREISTDADYTKYLWTCMVGAVLSASMQAAFERFAQKETFRLLFLGISAALTGGYYLILRSAPGVGVETEIRTSVTLFALFIAFIWLPVIRSRVSFNESFMAAFKAFFHSLFYAAVMMGGVSAIITAIDQLIYPVDSRAYAHTANFIFVLFAPIFFLSLIPVYPGNRKTEEDAERARDEAVARAAGCPKFLEVLLSYIIIPLTEIFTVILVVYIIRNIRGAFWTNNLLEPMLVSYAVVVILVYILSSRIENKFADLFRKIFPKVLIPIVLFQIASSVLSLRETGITHTRYFVILFGLFAASAGVVMSVVPVRKNGIIAAMLIVFSAVSVIPPVDAFTFSRVSQTNQLKSVLEENGMLQNNSVIPKSDLSDADKERIVRSVEYLGRMGYTARIAWLPENFEVYRDFYHTFGFYEYDFPKNDYRSVNVYLPPAAPIQVEGYQILAHTNITGPKEYADKTICTFENAGASGRLIREQKGEQYDLVLLGKNDQELLRFDTNEIFNRYSSYAVEESELSAEEATFLAENDAAAMTVVVQNASVNTGGGQTQYYADVYILIRFKGGV